MKRNILAVCDSEQEYAYHLMDALGRREEFPFEVVVFTGIDKLYAGLETAPVRILLIAEGELERAQTPLPVERLILLAEGEESPEDLAYPYVSKYSAVSVIVRKVMEEAGPIVGRRQCSKGESSISFLGFYSPVGRCLQTTFTFVMGQILARNHKVLYLNLEPCSGLAKILDRTFLTEFTDLLYFLDEPEEKVLEKLYGMVESVNGMDMLPPTLSMQDISGIAPEEWLRLLLLMEKSRYEYVLLDLSDAVNGLFELLRQCTRVYTITPEDGFALAKIGQYESTLLRGEYEDVLDKTRKCRLPVFRRLPRDLNHIATGELAAFVEGVLAEDERDLRELSGKSTSPSA